MAAPRIATHLPPGIAAPFAQACGQAVAHVPAAEVVRGGGDAARDILIVAPDPLWKSLDRPAGWPFAWRWVHAVSAGIDAYPDWMFEGVLATRSAGVAALPVAEYCLAAILAAARDLPASWIGNAREWTQRTGRRIAGSRLGIVGFGAIGQTLARKALALDMVVAALRRSDAPLPDGVIRSDSLAALIAWSDHLVLAAPATADTRHMIDEAALAHARPGLHLINVARGALIDDAALLAALDGGQLHRATLDVTEPEPLPEGHIFYRHPRIFLSPHCAATDEGMLDGLAAHFAANLARYTAGIPLIDRCDRAAASMATTA